MKLIKDLTDEEKKEFCKIFYENVDIYDLEVSCPWGCPWYFNEQMELKGNTIEEMVNTYINENIKEIDDLLFEQINIDKWELK